METFVAGKILVITTLAGVPFYVRTGRAWIPKTIIDVVKEASSPIFCGVKDVLQTVFPFITPREGSVLMINSKAVGNTIAPNSHLEKIFDETFSKKSRSLWTFNFRLSLKAIWQTSLTGRSLVLEICRYDSTNLGQRNCWRVSKLCCWKQGQRSALNC